MGFSIRFLGQCLSTQAKEAHCNAVRVIDLLMYGQGRLKVDMCLLIVTQVHFCDTQGTHSGRQVLTVSQLAINGHALRLQRGHLSIVTPPLLKVRQKVKPPRSARSIASLAVDGEPFPYQVLGFSKLLL